MNPFSSYPRALPAILVLGLVLAVTYPVLQFGFVLHDDPQEIVNNKNLQPLDGDSLKRIWLGPDFSRIYIPLSYTVLGLLATISRWWNDLEVTTPPTPGFFHGAGLFLHLLNTGLVMWLVRRLMGDGQEGFPWPVVLSGLAFGLHPAQVECFARAGNITVTMGGHGRCWRCAAWSTEAPSLLPRNGGAWRGPRRSVWGF